MSHTPYPSIIQITDTLKLSALKSDDSHTFFQLIESDREHLQKNLLWVENVRTAEQALEYIKQRSINGLPGSQFYKVTFNNEVVGLFGVKEIRKDTAEVGYWLISQAVGKGIISHCLNTLKSILLKMGIKHIEFGILAQNESSMRVAVRFGAQYFVSIHRFCFHNDIYRANIGR